MSEWVSVRVRMPAIEDGNGASFMTWDGYSMAMAWLDKGAFSYDDARAEGTENKITHWLAIPMAPASVPSAWIPTSEIMPAIGRDVLVEVHYKYTFDCLEAKRIGLARAMSDKPDGPWWTTHFPDLDATKFKIMAVVAWQPLPEWFKG